MVDLLSLDYMGDIYQLIKYNKNIWYNCMYVHNCETDLYINFTESMSQFVNEDIDVGGTLQ